MRNSIIATTLLSLMLIGSSSLAIAYQKEGNVVTKKTGGGATAVDTSTPNSTERTAATANMPTDTAAVQPTAEPVAHKAGKTKPQPLPAATGDSTQAYTHGGGVQSPGGERTCHVRGFKDPTGLIHEDHYQKCGTLINGMTSQCYADGRCRISY